MSMSTPRINNPKSEVAEKIREAVLLGLEPLRVDAPVALSSWAEMHFYLSAESSYVESRWKAYPFQIAILDCMGHDDIVEVDFMKAARVGFTKCLLAAIGYFAEHKKRNQALWQPSDGDRDEFTKVELEPMLRDVPVMERIFPSCLRRHKDNTLKSKKFLTGMLHLRGGTAAKSYRRISVDVVYLDELDAFDQDIEGEGDPFSLAKKRLEGAIFPKIIAGTTPKTKNLSHIETRTQQAAEVFAFHIPCPHCGHEHPLVWGGKRDKKEAYGFIWRDSDPDTVGHLCPKCGVIYSQQEYLSVYHRGRWINAATGIWIDRDLWVDPATSLEINRGPVFRYMDDEVAPVPFHVAFLIWTGYSPQATWPNIVREYLSAVLKAATGDATLLKTFTNTTLGEPYEEDVEKGDAQELIRRAEPYPLRVVPRDALVLVAFVDVQADRFEMVVWGFGRGEESWVVDYRVIDDVNPFVESDWEERLDPHLQQRYRHARGGSLGIEIVGVDTGYATHQAYRFCRTRERRKVYATKGETADNRPIKSRRTLVDVRQRTGRPIKHGCKLYWIGTDAAKDTIFGRLAIEMPGPGYMHFSTQLAPAFYDQLVSEVRILKKTSGQHVYKWVKPTSSTRNEVLDCTVGALWGLEVLSERYRDQRQFWDEMERRLAQPDLLSLLETPEPEDAPAVVQASGTDDLPALIVSVTQEAPAVAAPVVRRRPDPGSSNHSGGWL